jgi:hypothetical protein
MLPVGTAANHDPAAYPDEDKSYRAGSIVRQLVDIVESAPGSARGHSSLTDE